MEVFLEQSVVLLLLAWTGGFGSAVLVAGLTSRRRRQEWAALLSMHPARAPRAAEPLGWEAVGSASVVDDLRLPAPLLAAEPRFELTIPRTRREARTRR